MTRSASSICTPCQHRWGLPTCMNRIRERELAADLDSLAGDGKLRGILSPQDEAERNAQKRSACTTPPAREE
jgi:hypothetical protein